MNFQRIEYARIQIMGFIFPLGWLRDKKKTDLYLAINKRLGDMIFKLIRDETVERKVIESRFLSMLSNLQNLKYFFNCKMYMTVVGTRSIVF
jgi:hypothetical protein